ncbi:hypothetical protein [Pandoraea sp. SD6-2]|uniref:hypothetical protein n=1 Tax=Pandoraea sp. SD6-2 TaxID=1286093 RepID=UPI00032F86BD|nr:hypothetical protein [Pandoraea sp. SD6-2]EON13778.1 hypothetical protein C266_10054 [Pandoraea sp. SD6-2]
MSKNIKKFIQNDIFDWLVQNSSDPAQVAGLNRNDFWVQPFAKTDSKQTEEEKQLIARFESTKVTSRQEVDLWRFRIVDESGARQVTIANIRGFFETNEAEFLFPFEIGKLTFLQRLDFIIEMGISAVRPIPNRILLSATTSKEPILEADLENYLPKVEAWSIGKDDASRIEGDRILISKALVNLEIDNALVRQNGLEFAELAVTMPEKDHDWLFDQVYFAISCRRPEHLYLALYRIFEFFFPMKGLMSLKAQLEFTGSMLQLREYCRASLNWNVNHQYGARAAADYGGTTFAKLCLDRELAPDADEDTVRKLKADAIEKITELRHRLAHQTFDKEVITPDDLGKKIRAILSLLIESFGQYRAVTVA